jgi:ribulose 1,5-bisphosphate synthetase/thiazole synthase
MISMKSAGHQAQLRTVVARHILANYQTIVSNNKEGIKPMYRNKGERIKQKEEQGVCDKGTWFRKAGYTAMYSVPATKDSTLVVETRKALELTTGPSHTKVQVI